MQAHGHEPRDQDEFGCFHNDGSCYQARHTLEPVPRASYKAGYYSFLTSMYIWLFIFLFQRYFPDVETMLGGGILLSCIIAIGLRAYLTRHFDEYSD